MWEGSLLGKKDGGLFLNPLKLKKSDTGSEATSSRFYAKTNYKTL